MHYIGPTRAYSSVHYGWYNYCTADVIITNSLKGVRGNKKRDNNKEKYKRKEWLYDGNFFKRVSQCLCNPRLIINLFIGL